LPFSYKKILNKIKQRLSGKNRLALKMQIYEFLFSKEILVNETIPVS